MNQAKPVDDWLFVSDVDDTLLGDDEALSVLHVALASERPRVRVALNSSRPCASLRRSLRQNSLLPVPDFLIGALGTEIEDAEGQPVESYPRRFDGAWDRKAVEELVPRERARAHRAEYQTPFKVSYDVSDIAVVGEVSARLAESGIEATVIITRGRAMDIIPAAAGKNAAIAFLREQLHVRTQRVVVAGDSANDVDMFADENRGIVVANADRELKNLTGPNIYHARRPYAGGVLDGLKHWNVL